MPTSEQDDAARLAALLNADSDSDNDEETTVAERLRTAELLNRPSDAGATEHARSRSRIIDIPAQADELS